MELEIMQNQSIELINNINNKLNVKHDPDTIFLHLAEEVGEVARELSKKQPNWREDFNKDRLGEELIDVMMDIFIIANDNNINLSDSFSKKLNNDKKRFKLDTK